MAEYISVGVAVVSAIMAVLGYRIARDPIGRRLRRSGELLDHAERRGTRRAVGRMLRDESDAEALRVVLLIRERREKAKGKWRPAVAVVIFGGVAILAGGFSLPAAQNLSAVVLSVAAMIAGGVSVAWAVVAVDRSKYDAMNREGLQRWMDRLPPE